MSVSYLDTSRPDEFISVSDLESIGEASKASCDSVDCKIMTTTAIYETYPVCDAVDCTSPTDGGAAAEEGFVK